MLWSGGRFERKGLHGGWRREGGKGKAGMEGVNTHGVVLLVKVVDVAVQDLDEELDADGAVHARVGHPQRPLQALEHALAVAVQLQ